MSGPGACSNRYRLGDGEKFKTASGAIKDSFTYLKTRLFRVKIKKQLSKISKYKMLSNGSLRIVVLQVHVVRIYIFSLKQMIKNMKSWKYNCKFKYCEKQASIFLYTRFIVL